jgi:hypothetical protein
MRPTRIVALRRAALAGAVGGAATAAGAIVVQAVVQPRTTVPDDRWSYPWSSAALVPMSLLWASLHVLVFLGVLGFAASGIAGSTRTARMGLGLALGGTALLFVGELASIPVRDQHVDNTGAVVVGVIFAVATVLMAVGFLAAGISTIRAGLWRDWRRFTPMSVGVASCVVVALTSTGALATGIALYGLSLLVLGVALYTKPVTELEPDSVMLAAPRPAA